MTQPELLESEIIEAYESGKLKSVASRAEINRLKAAARATAVKGRGTDNPPKAPETKTPG